GARPVEQRQRPRSVGVVYPHPIGDLVAEMNQLVRREEARQLGGADIAHLDPAILDYIGIRDLARRPADRDGDIIVAGEMVELVDEIVAEQLGPGDAGRVDAGLVESGERTRRSRKRPLAGIVDAKFGIGERAALARFSVGRRTLLDVAGERLTEVGA